MSQLGKEGKDTSEYQTTKWSMIASAGLPLMAIIVDGITQAGLISSPIWLALLGGLSATLASLGYTFTRGKVKAAESHTIAQMATAKELGKLGTD